MKKVLMTILKIVFIVIIVAGIIKFGIELYRFCVAQRVINQAEGSLNGLSITDMSNSDLLKYEGEMRGSQVRMLINKVDYLKAYWPIPLNYAEGSIHTTEEIKSGANYLVSLETDEETGLVTSVMIVAQPTKVEEGDES